MKRPDGAIYEEFKTASTHYFENGALVGHLHVADDGDYTGRFWFRYSGGKCTRIYTRKTAPGWLLALLDEATGIGKDKRT